MSLTLYLHPLSSYCQKALIAFYENATPFEPFVVDDPESRAALLKISPLGKFPALRDEAKNQSVPESSIIIEYLAQHYPGRTQLVPSDPELALLTRSQDRFYDLYVSAPMQAIVKDRLRPAGRKDAAGVEEALASLQAAYAIIERDMDAKVFAIGDAFSMADCAAAPALYYANLVAPFGAAHRNVADYLRRLAARPSVARAFREAEPYRSLFPR